MNENELRARLIAAARNNPPGGHAPYAFEKRIMNALASRPAPNAWALWGGPLWKAAISCVVVTTLCGVWSFSTRHRAEADENFSPDLVSAVFAPPAGQIEDAW